MTWVSGKLIKLQRRCRPAKANRCQFCERPWHLDGFNVPPRFTAFQCHHPPLKLFSYALVTHGTYEKPRFFWNIFKPRIVTNALSPVLLKSRKRCSSVALLQILMNRSHFPPNPFVEPYAASFSSPLWLSIHLQSSFISYVSAGYLRQSWREKIFELTSLLRCAPFPKACHFFYSKYFLASVSMC